MYRAALALLRGDREGTIAHARRSVDLRAEDDHMGRAAAAALAGLAHWSGGDLEAAADGYAEAVAGMEAAGNLADVLGCSLGLADMRTAQGRLRDALSTLEHGLELATDPGGPTLRGTVDMHVALAEVLYERNDLDAVRRHLDAADQLGEHAGLPQSPTAGGRRWPACAQLDGDDDGALELLDEAEQRFNTDYSPAVRPVPAIKARLRLARGDVEEARRWATDRQLSPDDELSYLHEYEHLTLARVLLAEGRRCGEGDPAAASGCWRPPRRAGGSGASSRSSSCWPARSTPGGDDAQALALARPGPRPGRARELRPGVPGRGPGAGHPAGGRRHSRAPTPPAASSPRPAEAQPPVTPSPAWSTRSATGSWRSSGCCARELTRTRDRR